MQPDHPIPQPTTDPANASAMTVRVIDVGQGNCFLVQYPSGNFMLYDCGSTSSGYLDHAKEAIKNGVGDKKITTVVFSHGDKDHTWFIDEIPAAQNVKFILYGGDWSEYPTHVTDWIIKMRKNGAIDYNFKADFCMTSPTTKAVGVDPNFNGEALVYILAASCSGGYNKNTKSVVMLITHQNQAILLSGDADAYTEHFIMNNVPDSILEKCTIFIPAHHGSRYSTQDAFINKTTVNYAAVSASGKNMADGHPNCLTMAQLTDLTVDMKKKHTVTCSPGKSQDYKKWKTEKAVYVTCISGDIRFVIQNNDVDIYVQYPEGTADRPESDGPPANTNETVESISD